MFDNVLRKLFGTKHERELKRIRPLVEAINALEPSIKTLSDEALKAKTAEFKEKLSQGATVDDILVPAFAVCREASVRELGMRHYDEQLIGGIVLNSGRIAEMKTGEGKTLVATLACYLNALEGKGVHVVTVNDYLARRDAEQMGRLYGWLGLSTGVVVSSQGDSEKKRAYRCDITYGQNNEFGFDYLRDNMKFSIFQYMQRDLHFAIVDEVDSILVDEARTPLIISGPGEVASDKYQQINELIPRLRRDEHYTVDEKAHSVQLTEEGIVRSQRLLFEKGITKKENLFLPSNLESLHILNQCLRAHTLYSRDKNYLVAPDGKIVIIDEFTGRALAGRRWSDGLHQAVEAKEHVEIQDENRTLATISFQNLFRLYKKLSGMTGTADTEATEFHNIYKLDVQVIPTHRPIKRTDNNDLVYKTEREKFKAVVDEIISCHEKGQPVLVGTTSVEKSDAIHRMLDKAGVPHNVLNAKQHEREAYVVAQAGRKGAVTVATNMAGRGTDIVLGGNAEMLARMEVLEKPELFMVPMPLPEGADDPNSPNYRANAEPVLVRDNDLFEKAVEEATARLKARGEEEKKEVIASGGLHILGTERHESRRIDNQLRGRAGRQGDPGTSRFYLSLEDDLMRIFAGERIQVMMDRLGMEEGVPIEHPWVTKSVENAQKKVEERNFDIRKNLLEYDDVMNQQRKTIYALRRQILEGQYRSVPNEEEAKKGAQSERLVDKADARFVQLVAQPLEQMVRLAGTEPPPRNAPPEAVAAARDEALKRSMDSFTKIRTDILEEWIYRDFGARLDCKKYENDPKALLAFVQSEVPLSLTEQRSRLLDLMDEKIGLSIEKFCPANKHHEDWDFESLANAYKKQFGLDAGDIHKEVVQESLAQRLFGQAEKVLEEREQQHGPLLVLRVFRDFFLREIDRQWIEHLQAMEQLRDGIGLRGYGQKDPRKEYKKEGYNFFIEMMASVKDAVVGNMFHFEVQREEDVQRMEEERARQLAMQLARARATHVEAATANGEQGDSPSPSLPPPAARPAAQQQMRGFVMPSQPVMRSTAAPIDAVRAAAAAVNAARPSAAPTSASAAPQPRPSLPAGASMPPRGSLPPGASIPPGSGMSRQERRAAEAKARKKR